MARQELIHGLDDLFMADKLSDSHTDRDTDGIGAAQRVGAGPPHSPVKKACEDIWSDSECYSLLRLGPNYPILAINSFATMTNSFHP